MSRVEIVTPAPTGTRGGNRVTGERWLRMVTRLGHDARLVEMFSGDDVDAMVAIHARRSFHAIAGFRVRFPKRPLIVGMSGTDLYVDIKTDPDAQRALELADRLIVLQPCGVNELPEAVRDKARVIYQSVRGVKGDDGAVANDRFNVCVVGHLREVKDPFCTAEAVRGLPDRSKIHVIHVGRALSRGIERRAQDEAAQNPRYEWKGELLRQRTLQLIASCDLLVLSSRSEGGANVIGESIVCGTPVVSSRISGSIGLLGADYPGYFEFGDRRQLAELLQRAESDTELYADLRQRCDRLVPLFDPERELESWRSLLAELGV